MGLSENKKYGYWKSRRSTEWCSHINSLGPSSPSLVTVRMVPGPGSSEFNWQQNSFWEVLFSCLGLGICWLKLDWGFPDQQCWVSSQALRFDALFCCSGAIRSYSGVACGGLILGLCLFPPLSPLLWVVQSLRSVVSIAWVGFALLAEWTSKTCKYRLYLWQSMTGGTRSREKCLTRVCGVAGEQQVQYQVVSAHRTSLAAGISLSLILV